ncbi:MAG: FAD-binding protein, partial [Deltaproteobacteria bacterium]|nr:FAD-binding protein [Nannocystaceae bacterium]
GERALVVDVGALDRIAVPQGDYVRVGAGARWTRVVAGTHASGLTPPVLTDYLDLTVGGTLSVGGVGGQSFAHGLQVDNVSELEVVTGAGRRMRCSPHLHPELFHGCLGGLGQLGVIVEATLRLVPAPSRVRVRHLPFDDIAGFLDAQHVLARSGACDYLVGNFLPPNAPQRGADGWSLSIEHVEHLGVVGRSAPSGRLPSELGARLDREPPARELGYLEYVHRLDAIVRAWRSSGAWTAWHPWMDLFVPHEGAAAAIELALDGLDRDALGEGYVMTYPLLGEHQRAELPALPGAAASFLFDILPTIARGEHARLAALRERYDRVLAVALDSGATIYPIGHPLGRPTMDVALWHRVLGPRLDELARARRIHDPDGICGADLALFRTRM